MRMHTSMANGDESVGSFNRTAHLTGVHHTHWSVLLSRSVLEYGKLNVTSDGRHDPSGHEPPSRAQVSLSHRSLTYARPITRKWGTVDIFVLLSCSHSVITELIVGYMLPGRPVAMMM